jgi:hypothetical protein
MKFTSFTEMPVCQKAHQLVLDVYKFTASFPRDEVYGLTSQMRRASLSVSGNIAEAFGRFHRKPRWIPASLLAGGKRLAIRRGEYVCQGTVAGDIKMTWV